MSCHEMFFIPLKTHNLLKNIRPINYLISTVIQTTNKLYRKLSKEHLKYQRIFWNSESVKPLRHKIIYNVSKCSNQIAYCKSFYSVWDFRACIANQLILIRTLAQVHESFDSYQNFGAGLPNPFAN